MLSEAVEPASRAGWNSRTAAIAVVLLALATAASSVRIVAAPGIEFYLGPLFYLLAYRVLGVRAALVVAVAVLAPSYFWWGHPYSILLAVAHVAFIHGMRRPRRALAVSTLVFYLTIGGVGNWLVLDFALHAPMAIAVLTGARKAINDIMLAAIVDLVFAIFIANGQTLHIIRRRAFNLETMTIAITIIAVLGTITTVLIVDVRELRQRFEDHEAHVRMEIELQLLRLNERGAVLPDRLAFVGLDGTAHTIFVGTDPAALRTPAKTSALGCEKIDNSNRAHGANDTSTFTYWLSTCRLQRVDVAGKSYWSLSSTRQFAENSYLAVSNKILIMSPILFVGILLTMLLSNALSRSLAIWRQTVARFGTPDLSTPSRIAFEEFVKPVASFVEANNMFMTLASQRRIIVNAIAELSTAIALELIADISFDTDAGELCFTALRFDRGSIPSRLQVHPADRLELSNAAGEEQASIEIRICSEGGDYWHLLIARERTGPAQWKSGCIMRMQQPKFAQDRMLQQARLIELGGMASAMSHELKQPLFTIALAAENGGFQLAEDDRPGSIKALRKFERIIEQVERARAIIGRITRYARVDAPPREAFDLVDGITTATIFLRPLLIAENVAVQITSRQNGPIPVVMPRVGLEQIIVNALQNAVDAIATRRETDTSESGGTIEIVCDSGGQGITVTVSDNGTGLPTGAHETLFEAFETTKQVDKGTGLGLYICRQIMLEIGGTIAIASRPAPERGAVLTIRFAPSVIGIPDPFAVDGNRRLLEIA